MKSKVVEVVRYYSCDGKEFEFSEACRAYEQELKARIYYKIYEMRVNIKTFKQKANESRLQFLVAKFDALDALKDDRIVTFHQKMVEHYKARAEYHLHKSNLSFERARLSEYIDKIYMWFGEMKCKSELAKQDRKKKSLRWRQENTPDKWRTPNKIRVNKQPKENNNE